MKYFYTLFFCILLFISLFFFGGFMYIIYFNKIFLLEWEIISLQSINIIFLILLDWMSISFSSFVLLISSLVIFYSKNYMKEEKNLIRFLLLMILFIFSMLLMIFSPNLISILLGWDGLGLISYSLVIFFQNEKSYNAGMLTVISNRIGDIFLLMSIAWLLNFGSWNFSFYLINKNFISLNLLLIMMIMIAAMTKSAQIPFSAWLPAAMAAPTPVSALVHSSTLVTAGVYLLIRFSVMLNFFNIKFILLLIGSLTMFMSGVGANFEMDMKKVIALSTLSQLGLMMTILSLNCEKLSFFHLLMHALFKALLFLCIGVMIHNLSNFQDLRMSGKFMNQMSLVLFCFSISNLALCGMPFLTGFYSKDLIMEFFLMGNFKLIIFFLLFFSICMTITYSFRLIFNLMIMVVSSNSMILKENLIVIAIGPLILSICSIFMGSIFNWLIFPFSMSLFFPLFLKIFTLLICFLSIFFTLFFFINKNFLIMKFYKIKNMIFMFISLMWFMPMIFNYKFNEKFLVLGKIYNKYFDFGWNEMFSGNTLYLLTKTLLNYLFKLNNKQLKFYFLSIFFWLLIMIIMIIVI